MKQDAIVEKLKEFQFSEEDQRKAQELTRIFLSAINSRITEKHGVFAEYALRRVLEEMHAPSTQSILCLKAVLQLCRDDSSLYTCADDAELVSRIRSREYFRTLSLDDIYVETQDGVV